MVPRYVLQVLHSENHKIAKNSTTARAREKISADLDSLEFQKNFYVCLAKLKKNLLTTKLFIG